MIPGERKSSPSTSVAQVPGRARWIHLLRESNRKPLLMHMAHMGVFTERSVQDIDNYVDLHVCGHLALPHPSD